MNEEQFASADNAGAPTGVEAFRLPCGVPGDEGIDADDVMTGAVS